MEKKWTMDHGHGTHGGCTNEAVLLLDHPPPPVCCAGHVSFAFFIISADFSRRFQNKWKRKGKEYGKWETHTHTYAGRSCRVASPGKTEDKERTSWPCSAAMMRKTGSACAAIMIVMPLTTGSSVRRARAQRPRKNDSKKSKSTSSMGVWSVGPTSTPVFTLHCRWDAHPSALDARGRCVGLHVEHEACTDR